MWQPHQFIRHMAEPQLKVSTFIYILILIVGLWYQLFYFIFFILVVVSVTPATLQALYISSFTRVFFKRWDQ
jgi:hypothetical protein